MKTKHHPVKVTLVLAGLVLLVGLVAYVCLSLRIGSGVRAASDTAMKQYPGDSVEALMQCVEDSTHSLPERNRAVWALGQLGDRRALTTLRKYHTGSSCDHANALCQRELNKAINLLEGGVNASAWVWRRFPRSDQVRAATQ